MARARVSERTLLAADGGEAERMNDATGARYTLVANGKSFDYHFGANPHLDRLFGIFGFVTKIGNEANTVLNNDKEPGDADDAAVSIEEFLASAADGIWREVGEGAARGPKYDKDVLAGALVGVLAEKATGDAAAYRLRLDDKSYYAKVRANPEVMAAYMTAMAAAGKTGAGGVDSLA